jgi:hypothetical protein
MDTKKVTLDKVEHSLTECTYTIRINGFLQESFKDEIEATSYFIDLCEKIELGYPRTTNLYSNIINPINK